MSIEKLIVPSDERRKKAPFAVFECFQEIPCNPCNTCCNSGAVAPFADINNLPSVDYEKCTGCGICISKCPGLAIFVIDESYSDTEATVKIPSEMTPLPEKEETVTALDRDGKKVGSAKVLNVLSSKAQDKTNVVTLVVPKEQSMVVRNFERGASK